MTAEKEINPRFSRKCRLTIFFKNNLSGDLTLTICYVAEPSFFLPTTKRTIGSSYYKRT